MPSSRPATLSHQLGLRDLTLFSIACMVGTRWIPAAARAGPGTILLWLLAAAFFVVPLALAVAALTVRHPRAGGLYLWTRADFGPWHAFLAFWVYWVGIAFWFPGAALFYTSVTLSSLGPRVAPLADSRTALVLASLASIWIALGFNLCGLNIGKWIENLGAVSSWALGLLLAFAACLVWRARGSATTFHLLPDFSWDTVAFLATIAYAMSGFEAVGLMGGEIRDPARDVPRAAILSSLFVTVFYAAATWSLLVLLPASSISELNGLVQAGNAASIPWVSNTLAPVIAVLVLLGAIGQFGGIGASTSRMPFAAGVDNLLPSAFSRIHPRRGTPHISILALGGLASFLLIAIQFGDTLRAAYQTLVSLMVIGGFLPYLYIFGSAWRAGKRLSALSGWAVTILAIVASLVPTSEIHNVWLFELKLGAGTFGMVASAWLLYRRAQLYCDFDAAASLSR